jgi:transketolase
MTVTAEPTSRDFDQSAGHASMLLYSLLHVARVKAVDPDYETLGELAVRLEDIERFRQLDSRAAGHPEYRWTSVETTTGPLGQGVATWSGWRSRRSGWRLALSDLASSCSIFDVYVLAGDGDLMEDVSNEAASLAGHLRLDNLCWIYDNLANPEDGDPELILIGAGAEVTLCVDAYEQLTAEGGSVRVVSMPSFELFDRPPPEYRDAVLPPALKARVFVEEASTLGWERFVGTHGAMIGMRTFGTSGPLKDVQRKFGFTPEAIVAAGRRQLAIHAHVRRRDDHYRTSA